jgi:hypothetical protein
LGFKSTGTVGKELDGDEDVDLTVASEALSGSTSMCACTSSSLEKYSGCSCCGDDNANISATNRNLSKSILFGTSKE